jgi:DNA-binding NarL/FixJ family response regulator
VPGKAKKIAILNPDPEILVSLRGVLTLCGYAVCGASTDYHEIDLILKQYQVDLLIVDLPPETKGIFSAIKRWRSFYPDLPIVAYCCSYNATLLQRAMLAGIRFCVFRTQPLETFIGIVRDHLPALDRAVEHKGKKKSSKNAMAGMKAAPGDSVPSREYEIFKLLGQGFARKEIAEKLFISPRTVDAYLARLKNNYGISSCRELVRLALQANQNSQFSQAESSQDYCLLS